MADIVPAQLPPVGFLNRNQGQLKNETFTLVGYGVDIGDEEGADRDPRAPLDDVLPQERRERGRDFQINDRDSKAGGGSCFGDSGGAVFWGPYVLGDASYVNSLTCNATGSYQRDDTDVLQELPQPVPAVGIA